MQTLHTEAVTNPPPYERVRLKKRPSVKDLDARCKTIAFLLLALATTLCQGLSASTTSGSSGKPASPGQLTVTPSSITFGSVPVGTTQTQSATLTNSGRSDLTISQAIVNGSGFAINGLTMPLTLAAGQR